MANPRKFSEKIALHNQKQAEETAEFERIMREVSDVTSKVGPLFPGFPPAGSCVNECECDSKKKETVLRSQEKTFIILQVVGQVRGKDAAATVAT